MSNHDSLNLTLVGRGFTLKTDSKWEYTWFFSHLSPELWTFNINFYIWEFVCNILWCVEINVGLVYRWMYGLLKQTWEEGGERTSHLKVLKIKSMTFFFSFLLGECMITLLKNQERCQRTYLLVSIEFVILGGCVKVEDPLYDQVII